MEIFDENKLFEEASQLVGWGQIAFMACCCERMLPNYSYFLDDAKFGDLRPLRDVLNAVWLWVKTDRLPEDIAALVEACDRQAPDTAKFKSIYTSAALDAATAIAITSESLAAPSSRSAVEVASLARDTVDLFIQERDALDPNDPELESLIVQSDLMQIELQAQRTSLEALKALQHSDRFTVATKLYARWSNSSGSLKAIKGDGGN